MVDVVCEHCGGKDFYKEAGFFYCKECQVQSQELQEHEFQDFADQVKTKQSRKIRTGKEEKEENKITSWECYNYIILGLTQELINLGADHNLQNVVRILWLRYLEKLHVFRRGVDDPPKLQAINSAKDADIVYGRKRKKRGTSSRKSSTDDQDSTTLDHSSLKRERAKKRKALIEAHYEELVQKSQDTPSLHNETLTSLPSDSEGSNKIETLSYNLYATKELKKHQAVRHLRKHRNDKYREMPCHKMSYRKVSYRYRCSPYVISLNKIYSILYLGLLIIKDRIRLGDMLRFMREGNLSFNTYSHLLPEDYSEKSVNFKNFKKVGFFTHANIRTITFDIAKYLGVVYYVPPPDLIELCERYCKELNLPGEIFRFAKKIICSTESEMKFHKSKSKTPNYEGRVLSVILFTLKLLFGLDNVTEFKLSEFAAILNKSQTLEPKMFDFVQWLKYIQLRRFLLVNFHFASGFGLNSDCPRVDTFFDFISKKQYPEEKYNKTKDDFRQTLRKLRVNTYEGDSNTEYPPTLTPSYDYIRILLKHNKQLDNPFISSVISKSFSEDCLEHIFSPRAFLEIVKQKGQFPKIVHGGGNENFVVESVKSSEREQKQLLKERRKLVPVELTLDFEVPASRTRDRTATENVVSLDRFIEDFEDQNKKSYKNNKQRLRKAKNRFNSQLDAIREDLRTNSQVYEKHFLPYERYWLRVRHRVEAISHNECLKFVDKLPFNFRLVFNECCNIAQLKPEDFLAEFQQTELYLLDKSSYNKR